MKTTLITALLLCSLFAGACSRSDNPPITAAQATPEPAATPQAPPPQISEAEYEAERQRQITARAEAEKLLAVPTPQSESSAPIISGNDPGTGLSGLTPATNSEGNERITGPVSGTEVEVVSSSGQVIVAEVKTNGKGAISVQLPGPGTYLVRYTTGAAKGKVVRTITASQAGSVNVSVPPPSAAP